MASTTINKVINGGLNSDSSEAALPSGDYLDAKNIFVLYDNVWHINGNYLNTTYQFPPSTTVKCVGAKEFATRKCIYYFVWVSDGSHRILEYNYANEGSSPDTTLSEVIVNGQFSDADCIDLDENKYVTGINFIARDEDDGDLMYWVDTSGVPRKINIKRAKETTAGNGAYISIKKQFTNAIKGMPRTSPICAFETDSNIGFNNLKTKIFQFRYRYIYDDFERSVWSPISKIVTPFDNSNPNNTSIVNNKISLTVYTGDSTVKKIEVAFRYNLGKGYSDFFRIDTYDKEENNITNDTLYTIGFYNDGYYQQVDQLDSSRLYDNVPKQVNDQEVVNGNVVAYGGCLERYDKIDPDCTFEFEETSLNLDSQPSNIKAYYLNSYEYGDGRTFYRYQIVVTGNVISGQKFTILWTDFTGGSPTGKTQVTATSGDTAASIITKLKNQINVDRGTGNFLPIDEGPDVVSSNILQFAIRRNRAPVNVALDGVVNPDQALTSVSAWRPNSKHQVGLVYYDEFGRSSTVITKRDYVITTPSYSDMMGSAPSSVYQDTPYVWNLKATIRHNPPSWAKYYQLVRTPDLNSTTVFYWSTIAVRHDAKYAYLDISNLSDYQKNNNGTSVAYDFGAGDRIRIYKKIIDYNNTPYNAGTSWKSNVVYSDLSPAYDKLDYEILGVVVNPRDITDVALPAGTYIKIFLPTSNVPPAAVKAPYSSSGSTAAFLQDAGEANYFFEVYRPVKSVDVKEQVFYEFGEIYQISKYRSETDPNLDGQLYHQGSAQDQIPSTPVTTTIKVTKQWIESDGSIRFFVKVFGTATNQTFTLDFGDYSPAKQVSVTAGAFDAILGYTVGTSPNAILTALKDKMAATGSGIVFAAGTSPSISNGILQAVIERYDDNFSPFGDNYPVSALLNGATPPEYVQSSPAIIKTTDGDFYVKKRASIALRYGTNQSFEQKKDIWVFHEHFSDFFDSSINSNGRPNVYDPNDREMYYPNMVRYSQPYEPGTFNNGLNSFFDSDFIEVDRSFGDIVRMKYRDKRLIVFQRLKTGMIPVNSSVIRDFQGNSTLTLSSRLLNPIQYYAGDFGIGYAKNSLTSAGYADYFLDSIRGVFCRLSLDGVVPISTLYKMFKFFGENFRSADTEDNYNYMSFFDIENGHCYTTNGDKTIVFNELRNRFDAFPDFVPEAAAIKMNHFVTFNNGQMWTHDMSAVKANFYGVQKTPYIDVVFNEMPMTKKSFLALSENATKLWTAPNITTATGQTSNLVESDFTNVSTVNAVSWSTDNFEGVYHAAFLRDSSSSGGILNGEPLKGLWIRIKLQSNYPSENVTLRMLSLKFSESTLNR